MINNDEIIMNLVNDDTYLLWEVYAETNTDGTVPLNVVIGCAVGLVRSGIARCWISAVDAKHGARALIDSDAITMLQDRANWAPPKSDTEAAVWLGSAALPD